MSADRAALEALLQEREFELAQVREELTETNKGVVALYAELDERAEQLRHVSELKSRFLAYMSHEFRTPLGAVRSIARILLDGLDGPLNEEQRQQVSFIQASAIELTEMVNDQLDLAKIEAGRITVSPGWFGMVDLFSALRGMFKPILVNEHVSLVFEEPVGISMLYSDEKKVTQVLRNFISNALKFTQQGQITVRAVAGSDNWTTFSVQDTGIGIPEDSLDRVFEDFVQVDSVLQRRYRGTGLGLALCRRLAQLLGGDVSVVSTVGVGSTFSMTIPTAIKEAPRVE